MRAHEVLEHRQMKHAQLTFRTGFRVAVGNAKSQGAVMVLPSGSSEGLS
jgi:putative hemolysin